MMDSIVMDRYAAWPAGLHAEMLANTANCHVGTSLVSENERGRVWHLVLKPGERAPFHRHVLDYFWTVTAAGRGRQWFEDGRVADMEYTEGETRHLTFAKGESMYHTLQNIGDTTLSFVTVEYLPSANPPLPL